MKLKDITIIGGTVYLNIVDKETTDTITLSADETVTKYGDYEVIEHHPYDGEVTEEVEQEGGKDKKGHKKQRKAGTDIIILQAQ